MLLFALNQIIGKNCKSSTILFQKTLVSHDQQRVDADSVPPLTPHIMYSQPSYSWSHTQALFLNCWIFKDKSCSACESELQQPEMRQKSPSFFFCDVPIIGTHQAWMCPLSQGATENQLSRLCICTYQLITTPQGNPQAIKILIHSCSWDLEG